MLMNRKLFQYVVPDSLKHDFLFGIHDDTKGVQELSPLQLKDSFGQG